MSSLLAQFLITGNSQQVLFLHINCEICANFFVANVFLDGIISKQRCWDQCLLIYFRPVKIGPKSVNFCPFIPPSRLTTPFALSDRCIMMLLIFSFQNSKVSERLNGIISNQTTTPESLEYDEEKGIYSVSTKCHETDCQFEITVYEYKIPHGAP